MHRVRTTFSGPAGAPWVNTMYFLTSGGTPQQAANAAGAFWGAVDAFMATGVTWSTGTDVDEVSHLTGEVTTSTAVTPVSGAGALPDVLLPRATQGLLRLRTGSYVSGREIRGRWFIPGLTEADNTTGGGPTAALQTAVQNALNTLVADANSILVVYSPTHARQDAVMSGSFWGQWAVLRSRRD